MLSYRKLKCVQLMSIASNNGGTMLWGINVICYYAGDLCVCNETVWINILSMAGTTHV